MPESYGSYFQVVYSLVQRVKKMEFYKRKNLKLVTGTSLKIIESSTFISYWFLKILLYIEMPTRQWLSWEMSTGNQKQSHVPTQATELDN